MTYPNPKQQQVINHLHGPLLILAPAGTGKTRVMAVRLAAILSQGMPPERTLGVTFTNRAAEHMRTAVRESCGDAAKHCRIQTFHGLCAWMLRTEARDLGLHPDFVIYDEDDSIELMSECLGPSNRDASSTYHELADLKSGCPDECLTLSVIPGLARRVTEQAAIDRYHQSLTERNALDYADLVYRTRAMLALLPEKRAKWSARFDWLQMDEVQDTHVSEYQVIRLLASQAAGVAFFGDLDQTIYQWRGSDPDEVIRRLKSDFGPVTEISLHDNYRATKALLRVADRHAATFTIRRTETCPAPGLPDGSEPEVHNADHPHDEASWIAMRLMKLRVSDHAGRIGVLTRTHKRAQVISDSLRSHGVPHITVEQFDFARRAEIKDLLARLRLLLNPSESGALQRIALHSASGIGPVTVQKVQTEGSECALRLTDLARLHTHHDGEPFQNLLRALSRGTVVIFDVETTGLSTSEDEVIDIGAVKLVSGRLADQYDALLRPTRPLGESAAVHGISEETLHREGRDPAEILREFARFAEGAVLVGHNVGFDLAMVRSHAARLGIDLPMPRWYDTLDLSRRLLHLERHDLATVCDHLATKCRPSHRALADALATTNVLLHLAPLLADGARARTKLVSRHGKPFLPIAEKLTAWRDLSHTLRPADLCQRIISESLPETSDFLENRREENLRRFFEYYQRHDDPARGPADMLAEITAKIALARNLDILATEDQSIPILTVHQAKGLEFDTVLIAGLTEDEFPSYYSKKGGTIEEEKRLFYVAITRARKHLILTGHRINDWDYSKPPSSFLTCCSATQINDPAQI